jgi:hypothetical protein
MKIGAFEILPSSARPSATADTTYDGGPAG